MRISIFIFSIFCFFFILSFTYISEGMKACIMYELLFLDEKRKKKNNAIFFLHKRVIMAWKWGVIVTMLRKKRHFIDKKRTICIWRELIDEDINQSVHQRRRKWEKIIYWRKNTISFSCFIHRVLLDEG